MDMREMRVTTARRYSMEAQREILIGMLLPIQHFGGIFLDSVQQMTDSQWEFARACNRVSVERWRDALLIQDAETLQRF